MYTGLYASFHAAPQLPIKYPKFYLREHTLGDDRLPIRGYRAGRGPGGHQVSENVPVEL
jgi:hypothetical protein